MTPYEKFVKIVDEQQYFERHRDVLVALSGGLDSMTLFNWLYQARESLNISLSVAHVNHQQRAVSADEAKALQEKMADLGVPFYTAKFVGSFSEEKARHFRYDFFEKIMVEHQLTALVTAHHKDDLTENFLIRQIRGSRLRHLTDMATVQAFGEERQGLSLIRPLLAFEKSEFDAPDYFEDASNAENDYLRNRVRNLYLPALEKENPRFSENLASLTDEIQKAMSIVTYSARAYATAEKIDLIEFSREIDDLQYFILQGYIAKFPALEVSKAQFDELFHIIRREGQYFHAISNDYNFIKDRYHFYIEERSKATEFETAMTPYITGDFQEIDLPATGQIVIRKRQPGDRIQVNGIDKKLRRYFIDTKVALKKRGNPLIVVDDIVYGVLDVVTADLSKSLKHDKMKRTLYYREKR
ncbi:tRNA lysidine(34) synthetase TilS [Pseudolactococcus reticulitermitis]|uniref:tRNA(Ile)-lysidine synthase n=1 Tax=Pseudolactococcus reticulitermitis TaxID=2025039 RepID=A0A224XCQ6_9LACT|nr:tRNA lysidine(34) synthetase TilS [Lactococcus reticulitermitis]GAX47924.1 tRNA(Ile)-lysidine synthetase [Lactococcus reticulitermitis]